MSTGALQSEGEPSCGENSEPVGDTSSSSANGEFQVVENEEVLTLSRLKICSEIHISFNLIISFAMMKPTKVLTDFSRGAEQHGSSI